MLFRILHPRLLWRFMPRRQPQPFTFIHRAVNGNALAERFQLSNRFSSSVYLISPMCFFDFYILPASAAAVIGVAAAGGRQEVCVRGALSALGGRTCDT